MIKPLIFDATLRDGSHAIRHRITKDSIEDYCQAMDRSGVYAIIVGHGNGLGASSIQVGISLTSDEEMLRVARNNLERTKLGAFLIPGFGTINDDINIAINSGVDIFKVGCHCTEGDTTRQHIEYIATRNKEVYGVLMMYHMASKEKLLEEALKIQSYGAKGVILMDSAGASTPDMVKSTITTLVNSLDIKVGFHAHNNIGMAVGNTYIAVKEGASIIDCTLRGFGAGAGNCQMEAIVALLQKSGYDMDVDLYRLLDTGDKVVAPMMKEDRSILPLSIVSGMAGVFSAYKSQVLLAAEEFKVDPRDVFMELGRRKIVGGQEDMILQVAKDISDGEDEDSLGYRLSSLS